MFVNFVTERKSLFKSTVVKHLSMINSPQTYIYFQVFEQTCLSLPLGNLIIDERLLILPYIVTALGKYSSTILVPPSSKMSVLYLAPEELQP